jgi:PIN domain nuclease of toxin-antitoxin system
VSRAVVDASAVIALLLGERGAERVEALIAECALAAVNQTEIVGYLARNGAPEAAIREMLDGLRLDIVPFDAELAIAAGLLLPLTRSAGLSLGDRACLALAHRLGVKAITTDRSWSRVASAVGIEIELIR